MMERDIHKQSFMLESSSDFYLLERIFLHFMARQKRDFLAPGSLHVTYACLELFHCTLGTHYILRAAIIHLGLSQAELRWNPMVSDSLFLKKNHILLESGKTLSSGSRSLCSSSACVPAAKIITGCAMARSTKEKEEYNLLYFLLKHEPENMCQSTTALLILGDTYKVVINKATGELKSNSELIHQPQGLNISKSILNQYQIFVLYDD